MKIALIGASGFVGSALREEALRRGFAVTALVQHPERLAAATGMTARKVDVLDGGALTAGLAGHDAVVSAFSGHADADIHAYYVRGIRSIIAATKAASVARLLVVGGAGSLEVAPGKLLIDTPDFPAQWQATARGALDALTLLRAEATLDWTVVSPPPMLHPGERTGRYRVGADSVLMGEHGPSDISVQDYAVAFMDEVASPRHPRSRFAVAY